MNEIHSAPDKQCSATGCEAIFRDHRWGSIEAIDEGWFIQRNGTAWCPKHIPDWVEGWRASQKARARGFRPLPPS